MIKKDMTRKEIEAVVSGKGDFVEIDYLKRFLMKNPSIDMKKYTYDRLAKVYQRKMMFDEAGKMYYNAASCCITFSEKIQFYINACEVFIKAGLFSRVDEAMKKAMSEATLSKRAEIYFIVKQLYLEQARQYEKELKKNNALKIYEKVLQMKISETEKKDITKKILGLYTQLGKLKEYSMLKGLSEEDRKL